MEDPLLRADKAAPAADLDDGGLYTRIQQDPHVLFRIGLSCQRADLLIVGDKDIHVGQKLLQVLQLFTIFGPGHIDDQGLPHGPDLREQGLHAVDREQGRNEHTGKADDLCGILEPGQDILQAQVPQAAVGIHQELPAAVPADQGNIDRCVQLLFNDHIIRFNAVFLYILQHASAGFVAPDLADQLDLFSQPGQDDRLIQRIPSVGHPDHIEIS